jgi:hypothetical protein
MDPDLVFKMLSARHQKRQPARRTTPSLTTIARVRARRHRAEGASS